MRKGKIIMGTVAIVMGSLLGIWSLVGFMSTKDIEKPAYVVENKAKGYEVRLYKPQLRAEITLEGPYRESLYEGFRNLADFIFGNNTATGKIAMTAPVLSEKSQKIAMTAPVIHEADDSGNNHTIAFVMPSQYTVDTLPKPNNSKVVIRQVPEQRYAALKFRGYATEKSSARRIKKLLSSLERDGVAVIGSPIVAQYDPPWTPPFMRKNEILVPLK